MSYTSLNKPDDLRFYCNPSGVIELIFTCPRCGRVNNHQINPTSLIYGFEVECYHSVCAKPGDRFGYQLNFQPSWSGLILGLEDRPLEQ
jgi:hypothetical protein